MDKQKQKQIEEMYNLFLNYKYDQLDWKKFDCIDKDLFEFFYNAGYRKIDKNAVVLTREEFDELKSYTPIKIQSFEEELFDRIRLLEIENNGLREYHNTYLDKVNLTRKETAEKFASGFINDILPKIMNGHNEKALQIAMAMTNYCQEITEGKV